jgi:hypothetical protein
MPIAETAFGFIFVSPLGLGMREETSGWNLEMQMRAARAKLSVLELPVAHRRRAGG